VWARRPSGSAAAAAATATAAARLWCLRCAARRRRLELGNEDEVEAAGLHLDVRYVADIRFRHDLWILVRTAWIPFARRGS